MSHLLLIVTQVSGKRISSHCTRHLDVPWWVAGPALPLGYFETQASPSPSHGLSFPGCKRVRQAVFSGISQSHCSMRLWKGQHRPYFIPPRCHSKIQIHQCRSCMALDFEAHLLLACSVPALRRRAWPRLTSLAGAWSFVPHSLKETFYHQKSQTQMPAGAEHITKMTEGKIWTLGDCKEHVLRGQPLSAAVSGQLWEGVLDRGSSKAEFSWEI